MNGRPSPPRFSPPPSRPAPTWSSWTPMALGAIVVGTAAVGHTMAGTPGLGLALVPAAAAAATQRMPPTTWQAWWTMACSQALLVALFSLMGLAVALSTGLAALPSALAAAAIGLTLCLAILPCAAWTSHLSVPVMAVGGIGGAGFLGLAVLDALGAALPIPPLAAPWLLWLAAASGAALWVAWAYDDWPEKRHHTRSAPLVRRRARILCWTALAIAWAMITLPSLPLDARWAPAVALGATAALGAAIFQWAKEAPARLATFTHPHVSANSIADTAEALAADLHASMMAAGCRPQPADSLRLAPMGSLFHAEHGQHVQIHLSLAPNPSIDHDAIAAWKQAAQDALDRAWGARVRTDESDVVQTPLIPHSAHHALQRTALLAAHKAPDWTPPCTQGTPPNSGVGHT